MLITSDALSTLCPPAFDHLGWWDQARGHAWPAALRAVQDAAGLTAVVSGLVAQRLDSQARALGAGLRSGIRNDPVAARVAIRTSADPKDALADLAEVRPGKLRGG